MANTHCLTLYFADKRRIQTYTDMCRSEGLCAVKYRKKNGVFVQNEIKIIIVR